MTGGMAFEALNQIGHLKKDIIIILNDNEHSISKNVGALSEYLLRMITAPLYNRLRRRSYAIIRRIPRYGKKLYDFIYKQEARVKGFFVPGSFFEELGIRYFGPVDGHNLPLLIEVLRGVKDINNGPKIVHVITRKGKGYAPAEKDPATFHGIGPFDRKTGKTPKKHSVAYSEIVGRTLAEIARHDRRVVAITAAMKMGTGLYEFEKQAPGRFFDVGIAEQHAITFASALASKGFKPFVSIYSTFLQRAVDQVIHDVAISAQPVRLLIDRAGIVGEDGETHHGLSDIGIIRNIPNFIYLAPSNGRELRDMLYFAAEHGTGPVAIRFPRGRDESEAVDIASHDRFEPGRAKRLATGGDVALIAVGDMVPIALETAAILKQNGFRQRGEPPFAQAARYQKDREGRLRNALLHYARKRLRGGWDRRAHPLVHTPRSAAAHALRRWLSRPFHRTGYDAGALPPPRLGCRFARPEDHPGPQSPKHS